MGHPLYVPRDILSPTPHTQRDICPQLSSRAGVALLFVCCHPSVPASFKLFQTSGALLATSARSAQVDMSWHSAQVAKFLDITQRRMAGKCNDRRTVCIIAHKIIGFIALFWAFGKVQKQQSFVTLLLFLFTLCRPLKVRRCEKSRPISPQRARLEKTKSVLSREISVSIAGKTALSPVTF